MYKRSITVIGASFLCAALSGPVLAAQSAADNSNSNIAATEESSNATEIVREASDVVQKLKADPQTRDALKQAKAVYIVPDYGRAGLGVGGAGGQGVLIANNNGTWSAPAFYNIGTVSLGLEAGVSGGSVAFLIMSDKALDGFRNQNNFSLNADAGLTIVNWSHRKQASAGKGADVIAWSDTKGLYGDLAVSATDIFWDDGANKAYYQKSASARDIISGNVKAPESANKLQSEFSALESGEPTKQSAPMSKHEND